MGDKGLTAGTIFDDRFVIQGVAGVGGMATVYRALHKDLGKEIALKVLHAGPCTNSDEIRRFQQEAQLMSTISHPNITGVTAFGVVDQCPYVALEFLDGVTLDKYIEQRRAQISFERFASIFQQVCEGLKCAHEKGIVHRDLKPSNIFIVNPDTPNEIVKIVDFGIAKASPQGGVEGQKLTSTGSVLGTPLYMSPEQGAGLAIDLRTDIYSLGCIMFFCLMGKPPFEGDSFYQLIYQRANVTAPQVVLPKHYPAGLADLVSRCLIRQPARRYQSISALQTDLNALSAGRKIAAVPRKRHVKLRGVQIAIKALSIAFIIAVGCFAFTSPVVQGKLIAATLKSQWEKGDFKSTEAAITDALDHANASLAVEILEAAKPFALKNPSVSGASMFITFAEKQRQERFAFYGIYLLHCLPDQDWLRNDVPADTAFRACRLAARRDESGSQKGIGKLLEFADWYRAVERSVPELAIAQKVDKVLGEDVSLTSGAWKSLHSIVIEQWQRGDFSSAQKVCEILERHSKDTPENFIGAENTQITPQTRATLMLAAVLAGAVHNQQNESVLEHLLHKLEPDPKVPVRDKLPLFIMWAEQKNFTGQNELGLPYLQKAEKLCNAQKSVELPMMYLPVIGDGYDSYGQFMKGANAHFLVPTLVPRYEAEVTKHDYLMGYLLPGLSHCFYEANHDQTGQELYQKCVGFAVRSFWRSPLERWIGMTATESDVVASIDGDMRDQQTKLMIRSRALGGLKVAAFHRFGGRYVQSAIALHDTSRFLQSQGLDRSRIVMLEAAHDAEMASDFSIYAVPCYKDVVQHGSDLLKLAAAGDLVTHYLREKKFAEAEEFMQVVVSLCPKDDKQMPVSELRRIMIVRLSFLAKLGRWQEYADTFGALVPEQQTAPEFGRYWKEVYAYALTQVGREKDTCTVLDELANGETVDHRR